MPAARDEVEEAREEGIRVMNGWGPKEVLTKDGRVTGIVFKKCISVYDADHRFSPVYDENETITIECENILLSIGQSIEWGDLLKGSRVELNRNGTAKADPVTYQTAEPDIFVGGDVYSGPKFAIDAIAAGREGAESIHRFVNDGQSLTIGRNFREFYELDKDNILLSVDCFDTPARQPILHDAKKAKTFQHDRLTFTEEQVKAEASRCLGCGVSVVDQNRCIGCGLCTTRCMFDAIHLHRDHPEASEGFVSCEQRIPALLPYVAKKAVSEVKDGIKIKLMK